MKSQGGDGRVEVKRGIAAFPRTRAPPIVVAPQHHAPPSLMPRCFSMDALISSLPLTMHGVVPHSWMKYLPTRSLRGDKEWWREVGWCDWRIRGRWERLRCDVAVPLGPSAQEVATRRGARQCASVCRGPVAETMCVTKWCRAELKCT